MSRVIGRQIQVRRGNFHRFGSNSAHLVEIDSVFAKIIPNAKSANNLLEFVFTLIYLLLL